MISPSDPYATIAAEHCAWARNNGLTAREVCRSVYRCGSGWHHAFSAIRQAAKDLDASAERHGCFPFPRR